MSKQECLQVGSRSCQKRKMVKIAQELHEVRKRITRKKVEQRCRQARLVILRDQKLVEGEDGRTKPIIITNNMPVGKSLKNCGRKEEKTVGVFF